MKKSFLLLTCLLYFTISGVAQDHALIDSLKSVLPGISGTEKVKVLRDLCYYSASVDFDEAVFYGEKAIVYATEIGDRNGLGASYGDLGGVYNRSGRYESALDLYQKAIVLFDETENLEGEAHALHNMGLVYKNKADYTTALNYLFKALTMKNALEGVQISVTLSAIGEVYRFQKEYDKALEYYFQALEEARITKNSEHISIVLNNMEIIYRKRGDYDKALEYRMQVIAINKENEDDYSLAVSYNNLGELYSAQNKLEEALKYFNQSLEIKERLGNRGGIAHTSEELALLYVKLGDFQKASAFAEKSMSLAKEIGNRQKQLDVYLSLSQIYQAFGQYEQALVYHIDYTALKDSLFNTAKETLITDMETKYQTSKKEAENALLKLEAEQQLATIAQKNQQVTLTIIGLLIVVTLAGLLFRAYRQKIKNNQVLMAQKEELARLNATKDRFFGIIAHDLRGPLTALQGISGLLSYNIKKGNTENLNKIALQIEDSAQKVNTLLDNLLKWALSQGGAMPHRPQRLALKPILEESLHYFKDMAAAKDIHLHADIAQDVHIHADKETLSTIFRNLINNSIKFTPRGGAVNLAVTDKEDQVQIDVQDNGKGIEEEKLKNIFVLDDHKSTSGTANEKGTGLGLVLVDDFVRLNQGTIRVASKPGDGSVFSIMLPTKYAKAG